MIRDRAAAEGRLEADAVLNVIAPAGFLPKEILLDFQKRERIQVILHEETFPSALLRRALKASPGQYDAAIVFHHQVSALRNERRLISLYDSRVKFPTNIAPDFRKLPDERNLMDTAPLQWGLLGTVAKHNEEPGGKKVAAIRLGFWPAILIGGEATDVPTQNFVTGLQASIADLRPKGSKSGLTYFLNSSPADIELATQAPSVIAVSHGSLVFPPLKDLNLELRPIRTQNSSDSKNDSYYMLWILTAAAIADGNLEGSRKLIRFLIDPVQNLKLVQHSKVGATTLRHHEGFDRLPESLLSSYFRKFPLDKIRIERDERVRQADELIEQSVLGAAIANKPLAIEKIKPAKQKPPPTPVIKAVKTEDVSANETVLPTSPTKLDQHPFESPVTEPSEEPLPAD